MYLDKVLRVFKVRWGSFPMVSGTLPPYPFLPSIIITVGYERCPVPLEESLQSLLGLTIMQASGHFNQVEGSRWSHSRCRVLC